MLINKNVRNFADYLVFHYSIVDQFGTRYLYKNDIPEIDLDHFCSIISANNKDYASEACGPDNEYFFKEMLPALNKYLSNSFNNDYELDFSKTWKKGIREYYSKTIDELLDEALLKITSLGTNAA